jgi:MoaA/NifB/PqqE/SkfB family radical SAM enzyme
MEFLPWSKKTLSKVLMKHQKKLLGTLDLQLSAACSGANCIYCDSKPKAGCANENESNWSQLHDLLLQSVRLGLDWIYICGLGEPLEDPVFDKIINFTKKEEINVSVFTNGVFISDKQIAKTLKESNVNIVLKLDTFDENAFDIILGKDGIAKKIYNANELLLEVGYGSRDGLYTDLAYSIVPTIHSLKGIPSVINFANKHGIFPSVGELEFAGLASDENIFSSLNLTTEEKIELKILFDEYAKGIYKRPICPAIITGIHIDNVGNCIVDKVSGLNCKWFLLTEPDIKIIGNINRDSVAELFHKVIAYRKNVLFENKNIIKTYAEKKIIFGGCGGNILEIIDLAYKTI